MYIYMASAWPSTELILFCCCAWANLAHPVMHAYLLKSFQTLHTYKDVRISGAFSL